MQECDIFMKKFSTETRSLWNKNLNLWIKHLEDNLEGIKIDHENIDFWTKNPPIHNCRLYFNDYQIFTKKWTTKIVKFAKALPCMSQIKRIKIDSSGRCQFENREGPAIEKVINNLDKISNVLGHEPSRRPDPTEPPKKHSVYFSDIISAKKYYGIINFKLMIFPKVIQESKILYVDSKYILDNDCVRVCNIEEEDFPFICNLNFGDPRIPIFKNVKKIKLYRDEYNNPLHRIKINKIIRKYYPNLKNVKLDGDFVGICRSAPKLCDIMESTNTKLVRRQSELIWETPILLKAENAIVTRKECEDGEESFKHWYKCTIEVSAKNFTISDKNIYILIFDIISIGNCSKTIQSPSHLKTIEYLQTIEPNSLFSNLNDWLILSTTSLTSISPTYTSFSDCCIESLPSPFSPPTLLPSNLSFYNSLSPSIPFSITCPPIPSTFYIYKLFFHSCRLLHLLAPSASRYCIEVLECAGPRSFKDVFTEEVVERFKAFRVVGLVEKGMGVEEVEEMVERVSRWARMKGCTGVVLKGYEEQVFGEGCVRVQGCKMVKQVARRVKVPMGVKVVIE
ncbi:unnamed protein product [Moneuplotes crassus]|uniref:Uncharacterized protein n=1 Tax=Euplotes crassus TaxID=5936 RepID=A0AAD2D986_EUPCR|nr:unnamed protein product [Moneuplotes crassus]